jgi:hypothetical protein
VGARRKTGSNLASITAEAVRGYGDAKLIRNNQNRRRRGGNGPRPQQMSGGNNYGNRLDNRQRGNASQLLEKYRALARDAQQAGDRVTAEYYLQYAEHYYRVLGDYRDKQPEQGRQRGRDFYEEDGAGYGDDSEGGDDDRIEARGDVREDDRETRDEDDVRSDDSRGNWQGDRPRERNREPRREDNRNENRGEGRNEGRNEGRDRQERGDRQSWANRGGNDAPRGDRAERGDRRERPEPRERRPDYRDAPRGEARAPAEAAREDSPIPGLPGPATLRINRKPEPAAPAADLPGPAEGSAEAAAAEAPKRRGRPRKVAVDAAEG